MASNLQVDQDLSATAQSVMDQSGNISSLSLSTDKVGNLSSILDESGGQEGQRLIA